MWFRFCSLNFSAGRFLHYFQKDHQLSIHDMSSFCLPSVHPLARTFGTSISFETSDLIISPSWAVLLCFVFVCFCVCACVCKCECRMYGWHKQFFCCDITFILQSHFRVAQPLYFVPHATSFSLKSAEICRKTSVDLVRSKTTTRKRKNMFRLYSFPLVVTDSNTSSNTIKLSGRLAQW